MYIWTYGIYSYLCVNSAAALIVIAIVDVGVPGCGKCRTSQRAHKGITQHIYSYRHTYI